MENEACELFFGYQIVRDVECFGRPGHVGSFFIIARLSDGSEWAHFFRKERSIAPDMMVPDMVPDKFWGLVAKMEKRGISPRDSAYWGPLPTGRKIHRIE